MDGHIWSHNWGDIREELCPTNISLISCEKRGEKVKELSNRNDDKCPLLKAHKTEDKFSGDGNY